MSFLSARWSPQTPAPGYHARPLILAAEDNPIKQKLLTHFLTRLSLPHQLSPNGAVAVSLYTSYLHASVRCILMDVSMPVLDGIQATAQIRAFEAERGLPRVRIVFMMAGAVPSGQAEWARERGADGILVNPVSLARVREAVRGVELEERVREEARLAAVRRLGMVTGHVGRGGDYGA